MIKIRQDNPKIPLQEAVDLGCFWKNQTILKSGFSSQQLMFGRGLVAGFNNEVDLGMDIKNETLFLP